MCLYSFCTDCGMLFQETQLHFMDIGACREELSLDLARELLIAISYSIPDKVLDCVSSERSNIGNGVAVIEVDGADDLRCLVIIPPFVLPFAHRHKDIWLAIS
ncbi:hypothetical protein RJ639_025682 [Escallonia herrerae]|uniref:Uncharacterized protein n=1 Tax=Escallonia herrerae TaxID=1293975 RepID=A0AA88SBX1_9ASTE|nr:hypothetical protein RJ639_025682 [Escallonia herrerae]